MSDQRIRYDELMVGFDHPSLDDTLNRLTMVQHDNDGRHNISSFPVGFIAGFIAIEVPPTGWLECNGASLSRTSYADLYSGQPLSIGKVFGAGAHDNNNFLLPDLRGRFLRGWAHGSSLDPDRASRTNRGDGTAGDHVGTTQADGVGPHTHVLSGSWSDGAGGDGFPYWGTLAGANIGSFSSGTNTGNESRPENIYVMWCIRHG